MTIKLHLGAHKTATTHIQQLLSSTRAFLEAQSIELSTPQELRPAWLNNFLDYVQTGDNNAIVSIRREKKAGHWILSEENLAGVSYDLKLYSGIYPFLKKRMNVFKEIFSGNDIEIFFSLRSYENFYRSAYLEVVRNRGYLPFDEFYAPERFAHNSWISVIETLVNVFGERQITLWRYEDFNALMPTILTQITGIENISVMTASHQHALTRPSLSARSITVLQSYYNEGRAREGNQFIEHLMEKYPVGEKYPPFMPFNSEDRKRLQQQYMRDVEAIRLEYPNINFLKPLP